MSNVFASVLDCVGNTPMVHLSRIAPASGAPLLAKLEYLNPGGSVKSRTALGMIRDAEEKGLLKPGSTIIEATSGNEGIGLAMVGAVRGYRVKVVMPDDVPMERKKLLESFGAEVVLIPAGASIDETMRRCMQEAQNLAQEIPDAYLARQFSNPANPRIHELTTGKEIIRQVNGPIAAFVAGVGTGGTLTGVARALKAAFPQVRIVAVEPENAAVLSNGRVGTHIQYGIGEGFVPDVLDTSLIDEVQVVSDDAALAMARRLALTEGIMAGISGGSNVAAALAVAQRTDPAKGAVVTIIPDSSERYFSSMLFGKPA